MGSLLSSLLIHVYTLNTLRRLLESDQVSNSSFGVGMWMKLLWSGYINCLYFSPSWNTWIRPSIQEEEHQYIALMDVKVRRKGNKNISSQKKIHTDKYLNLSSHHHPRTFTGVVKIWHTEHLWTLQISRGAATSLSTFKKNGYPDREIEPVMMKRSCPTQNLSKNETKEEDQQVFCLSCGKCRKDS